MVTTKKQDVKLDDECAANKMREAQESLRKRFHSGIASCADCIAILDVLRFVCDENPLPALKQLPAFRTLGSNWVKRPPPGKFQGYGRVHWFRHTGSGMKFCVESERREGWLAPYSVTLFADDRTGLLSQEVFSILEVLPKIRLTLVEFALDFSPLSTVNRDFVRRWGRFGKSQLDFWNDNPAGDWWGSRHGKKRVKSYFKDQICGHRVELRLRSQFLKHYGVRDVFDFPKFLELFPRHHIFFARLDKQRLIERLESNGISAADVSLVLHSVEQMESDLWMTLSYLRRVIGLKNVQRLLIPLKENTIVRDAIKKFAAEWPATPRRLE